MICPACTGKVKPLFSAMVDSDMRGVCQECAGVYLRDRRVTLATNWCTCKGTSGQECYYWSDRGHGWLHTVCGQITQTG